MKIIHFIPESGRLILAKIGQDYNGLMQRKISESAGYQETSIAFIAWAPNYFSSVFNFSLKTFLNLSSFGRITTAQYG